MFSKRQLFTAKHIILTYHITISIIEYTILVYKTHYAPLKGGVQIFFYKTQNLIQINKIHLESITFFTFFLFDIIIIKRIKIVIEVIIKISLYGASIPI